MGENTSSSFYVSFFSQVKMNTTNRPVSNVWVLVAQLVEHSSASAEAMGSNPVEALKVFDGFICYCENCDYNCHSHTFI